MAVRVYLDTNIYNRQFDDQTQRRIWLETEACSIIIQMIENRTLRLITSFVVSYENSRNPHKIRQIWVARIQKSAIHNQDINHDIQQRAQELEKTRFKTLDALHVACAEAANCDYFITCDDRLVRAYKSLKQPKITICNPTKFIRMVKGA